MLQFRVLVKRISRSPAVLFLSRIPVPPPLSPKFHRINIFADPHPLNLSTQHFPKIGGGPGFPFPANQSAIPSHQARSAKVPAFPCKSRPLFSIGYELPNLQAVCFHIHACNGGVYPPPALRSWARISCGGTHPCRPGRRHSSVLTRPVPECYHRSILGTANND